jgi:hypothetical protein
MQRGLRGAREGSEDDEDGGKPGVSGFEMAINERLDLLRDDGTDEWWRVADNESDSPMEGSESPLQSLALAKIKPVQEEDEDADEEEEQKKEVLAEPDEYSEQEVHATRVVQRLVRKFIAKLRGEEQPQDILEVVKGFVARRKSMLLKAAKAAGDAEDTEEADGHVAAALLDAFGNESLAGRKPAEVEKYLQEFGVRDFIVEQLREVLSGEEVSVMQFLRAFIGCVTLVIAYYQSKLTL